MKLFLNLNNGMMLFVKWMYKILFVFVRVMLVCLILGLSCKVCKFIKNCGDDMFYFFRGKLKCLGVILIFLVVMV